MHLKCSSTSTTATKKTRFASPKWLGRFPSKAAEPCRKTLGTGNQELYGVFCAKVARHARSISYATLETPLGLMICPSTFEPRPSRFDFGITSSPFRTVKFSPKPKWRPGSVTPTPRGPSRTPAPGTGWHSWTWSRLNRRARSAQVAKDSDSGALFPRDLLVQTRLLMAGIASVSSDRTTCHTRNS
jgi:hypothetical protein